MELLRLTSRSKLSVVWDEEEGVVIVICAQQDCMTRESVVICAQLDGVIRERVVIICAQLDGMIRGKHRERWRIAWTALFVILPSSLTRASLEGLQTKPSAD